MEPQIAARRTPAVAFPHIDTGPDTVTFAPFGTRLELFGTVWNFFGTVWNPGEGWSSGALCAKCCGCRSMLRVGSLGHDFCC